MAASRGNGRAVRTLVQFGKVDINITDDDGRTALHLAVAGNHVRVISYLSGLGKGWPEDLSGYSAIHLAAFLGDNFEKIFEAFLGGYQKTEPKRKGGTNQETEEKLLKKAEEIFNLSTSAKGETVLHVAAHYNNASVIKFILSHNPAPSVDILDKRYRTPLMCAAKHGSNDAVTILLRNKSNVDVKDSFGRSALHLATTSEVIKTLRDGNANSFLKDNKGFTPLLCAASTGNNAAVEALIPISDVNAVDNEGQTALHLAATSKRNNTSHVIKTLLDGGAKSFLKDKKGFTPLLYAASIGNNAAVKALIPISDVNAVDKEGQTALQLAITFHLRHAAPTGTTPADAASRGAAHAGVGSSISMLLINQLLSAGANKNVTDDNDKLLFKYPGDAKTIQMEDARAIASPRQSHLYRDDLDDSTDDGTEEGEEEDEEAANMSLWL